MLLKLNYSPPFGRSVQNDPYQQINQQTFSAEFFFSGHMEDLSDQALSSLHQHALRYGKDVEVLYHPFGLSEGEKAFDEHKTDFITFHRSPHRLNEANALRRPGIPV